jgi:hypothetical protein
MRPDGTFLTTVQRAAQKEKKEETDIHPFRIDIPQADLDDLQERLARTRWPVALAVAVRGPDKLFGFYLSFTFYLQIRTILSGVDGIRTHALRRAEAN